MGRAVSAVRTWKWVETLPMGIGAVLTCKEASRSLETEPPPVLALRQSRHRLGWQRKCAGLKRGLKRSGSAREDGKF